MNNEILIKNYRNIGISAHIDAGKTTTTERILYYTGITHKIGEVHEGQATMDWMDQEQERGITITSAATTTFWNGMCNEYPIHRINIIDTPGHIDFTIEVERCMRIIDGACMIYCAVAGVQSQSEVVWRQSVKYNIPKIIFINKMDRIGSDYFKVYLDLIENLKATPVPIFIPYVIDGNFIGIVDLLKFKIIYWDDSTNGMNFSYDNIPDSFIKTSIDWRDKLLEIAIDGNEILVDKYLNQTFISNEEIINELRCKTITCQIQPMLCGSSIKNKGVQCLLDAIVNYLPSPQDSPYIEGEDNLGEIIHRKPLETEKFSALAFKVMNDPFVGQLVFFRVYSGVINSGDLILNSTKNKKERLGRILQIHANHRQEIKKIGAGNIAAAVGLKDVITGDTLCDINFPIILEKITFPEPVISQSLELSNKSDQERIGCILTRFIREDPSFYFHIDNESNQIIISGMGELHLEVLVERIRREYDISLLIGRPRVSYRETIKSSAYNIEGKYIRQSGGRGQYGHVVINVSPNKKGFGFEFLDQIKGGVIPKEYIPTIHKSIIDTLKIGVLAGYPVLDIIVTLVNGSYHDVDSNENAFKIAASIAIKDAIKKANPVLLEPIMNIDIEIPDFYMGTIIGDISSRRGVLVNIEDLPGNYKIIKSTIPLSELFGYSTILRSLTQGRGIFNMIFRDYSEVPFNIFNNIINKI